jgi:uncharacterized protein (DUF1778 family)
MPRKSTPKRGRPPRHGVAATERIEFRITPDQLAKYQAAAARAEMSLSTWATAELDAAVDRPPARSELRRIKAELQRIGNLVDDL